MIRAALVLVSVFALVACQPTRTHVSHLQVLDGMRLSLLTTANDSQAVSADLPPLQRGMARDDFGATRRAAVRLRVDARELCHQTGLDGWKMRQIQPVTRRPIALAYIRMALRVMVLQWWEGATLLSLSELVWQDPYVSTSDHAQRFYSLQLDARWYAWQASRAAMAANTYRAFHWKEFRYIRVPRR